MVSIDWCTKQKNGIMLNNQNNNMSDSYLKMAEDSIKVLAEIKDSKTSQKILYGRYHSKILQKFEMIL